VITYLRSPTGLWRHLLPRGTLSHPSARADLWFWVARRVTKPLYIFPMALTALGTGTALHALLGAIPRPDEIPEKEDKRFRAAAAELFDRILQVADNAGATDEHRAVNYLAVRYPAIYARTAAAHAGNASLTAVDVRPSRLSGARSIVDVIFSYTNRNTDFTEKFFVRCDMTEEFPFLVTKMSPYLQG